jgi:hypothetical protein
VDIAKGEATERELDSLIRRRHDRRVESEGERREREAWQESEARHAAQRREANRHAWRAFHQGQAARHRAILENLVGYHESEAERYGHHQREEYSC